MAKTLVLIGFLRSMRNNLINQRIRLIVLKVYWCVMQTILIDHRVGLRLQTLIFQRKPLLKSSCLASSLMPTAKMKENLQEIKNNLKHENWCKIILTVWIKHKVASTHIFSMDHAQQRIFGETSNKPTHRKWIWWELKQLLKKVTSWIQQMISPAKLTVL